MSAPPELVFQDLYALRERARSAAARGDLDGAISALVAAAAQTHVAERDYLSVLTPLAEGLSKQRDTRGALTVLAYIASIDSSAWKRAEPLLPHVPPIDRAPILAAQGRMSDAAVEVEGAGRIGAAAIYREKAMDWIAARALWSRLAHRTDGGEDVYVAALVRFNLARCARQCGDADEARRSLGSSVRLLEEAADHFESIGQRERAFDCFQVLVQVGRESGAFEDMLEGFVNSIRILREDHLDPRPEDRDYDFALELYDTSIAAATERGESRAAATLARQAAEYVRSLGITALASDYALKQAEQWRSVATHPQTREAPPAVAENALRAAIVAFAEIGQYARVGELYGELGQLDLDPSRRAHYAHAAKRYEGVRDEPLATFGKQRAVPQKELVYPDLWHVDVLEWERKGNAAEPCLDVLVDARWVDHERHEGGFFRRKAMLARLTALKLEGAAASPEVQQLETRVRLAQQLGEVQLYAALSPLEALFDSGERRLKMAVLQALERMEYTRSFITVRAGLRDEDQAVVQRAAKSLSAFHFPHAVNPLSRIMSESSEPAVRAAVLRALSRIDTLAAAEIVLGAIEHGTPADRAAALAAVKETHGTKLQKLVRETLPRTSGPLRASLLELIS
jgi:hypothetical protein